MYGLLWVLVTPRSDSSNATGFNFIDEQRSAWSVSWPFSMSCFAHVSFDKLLGQCCRLCRDNHPAHDIAAEDIQDHIEVEMGPFDRT